jgi:hypothetical protein
MFIPFVRGRAVWGELPASAAEEKTSKLLPGVVLAKTGTAKMSKAMITRL